jgi:RNA polymerase sigma-70 factor (ECF subfamily)
LSALCRAYWKPLYAYARRRGHSVEDAEDLTQGFFAHLIEKRSLARATRERGRFRSFLLASFKNYAANEWDRARATKRGGGAPALDLAAGEKVAARLVDSDPEATYERQWACLVLEQALRTTRSQYRGEERTFEALKTTLGGGRGDRSYREIGAALGISEGAARAAAHRLRGRYRQALWDAVGRTVRDVADIEDEIRYLLRVVAG